MFPRANRLLRCYYRDIIRVSVLHVLSNGGQRTEMLQYFHMHPSQRSKRRRVTVAKAIVSQAWRYVQVTTGSYCFNSEAQTTHVMAAVHLSDATSVFKGGNICTKSGHTRIIQPHDRWPWTKIAVSLCRTSLVPASEPPGYPLSW